jgi:hypothetical protein
MKSFANTKLNAAWGGGGIWEVGVTGEGGHLGQMARNSNRVIPKKGPRKLKKWC